MRAQGGAEAHFPSLNWEVVFGIEDFNISSWHGGSFPFKEIVLDTF